MPARIRQFCAPLPGAVPASFLTALFCLTTQSQAQVDPEITKEVWKQKYGVLDAQMNQQAPFLNWLAQDAAGDGVSNGDEFIAGNNPFKKLPGEPHFLPPAVASNPTTLSLTFPTFVGKLYGTESSESLTDAWTTGALPSVTGDGTIKMLNVPKSAGKFFHLSVTDQATQGDQVSDWAKYVLGLSPGAPISSQTSFNHTSLAADLDSQNIVSLTIVDSSGTQPANGSSPAGDYGLIRITRSGFMLLGPVTVPLVKSGTAVEGTDFASLPASVTFPIGVKSLDVRITPLFNASRTSSSTLFLTAASPGSAGAEGNYTLGSAISTGVTIYPASSPGGTGLTAKYYAGSSGTSTSILNFGGRAASYSFTKSGSTVTATVTYSGTPASPLTASAPVTLRFTSGNLNISPLNTSQNYTIATANGTTNFTVSFIAASASITAPLTGTCEIGNFVAPVTRLDTTVDFNWGSSTPDPLIPVDNFSTRWTGQVMPQYSQKYYFVARIDDGVQLWVNNQLVLTRWPGGGEPPRWRRRLPRLTSAWARIR